MTGTDDKELISVNEENPPSTKDIEKAAKLRNWTLGLEYKDGVTDLMLAVILMLFGVIWFFVLNDSLVYVYFLVSIPFLVVLALLEMLRISLRKRRENVIGEMKPRVPGYLYFIMVGSIGVVFSWVDRSGQALPTVHFAYAVLLFGTIAYDCRLNRFWAYIGWSAGAFLISVLLRYLSFSKLGMLDEPFSTGSIRYPSTPTEFLTYAIPIFYFLTAIFPLFGGLVMLLKYINRHLGYQQPENLT